MNKDIKKTEKDFEVIKDKLNKIKEDELGYQNGKDNSYKICKMMFFGMSIFVVIYIIYGIFQLILMNLE